MTPYNLYLLLYHFFEKKKDEILEYEKIMSIDMILIYKLR